MYFCNTFTLSIATSNALRAKLPIRSKVPARPDEVMSPFPAINAAKNAFTEPTISIKIGFTASYTSRATRPMRSNTPARPDEVMSPFPALNAANIALIEPATSKMIGAIFAPMSIKTTEANALNLSITGPSPVFICSKAASVAPPDSAIAARFLTKVSVPLPVNANAAPPASTEPKRSLIPTFVFPAYFSNIAKAC